MKLKTKIIISLEAFNTAFIAKIYNDDLAKKYGLIMWNNYYFIMSYITKTEINYLLNRQKTYLDIIKDKEIYHVYNNLENNTLISKKTTISIETEDILKDKYFEEKYCDDMENVIKFKKTYRKLKIENILNYPLG